MEIRSTHSRSRDGGFVAANPGAAKITGSSPALRLVAPGTGREDISVILSHQSLVTCYGSHGKSIPRICRPLEELQSNPRDSHAGDVSRAALCPASAPCPPQGDSNS